MDLGWFFFIGRLSPSIYCPVNGEGVRKYSPISALSTFSRTTPPSHFLRVRFLFLLLDHYSFQVVLLGDALISALNMPHSPSNLFLRLLLVVAVVNCKLTPIKNEKCKSCSFLVDTFNVVSF